ncbi:hypothetical protein L227DRAFT_624746, partial [Lentinus tigrinus ALCF2SS1-6]
GDHARAEADPRRRAHTLQGVRRHRPLRRPRRARPQVREGGRDRHIILARLSLFLFRRDHWGATSVSPTPCPPRSTARSIPFCAASLPPLVIR